MSNIPPPPGSTPPPPGGGGMPPQPPAGPPPGGGFAPPPAGGYQPGGAPAQVDATVAFQYGWKKFQENFGQMMIALVVLLVGVIVAVILAIVVQVLFVALFGQEDVFGTRTVTGFAAILGQLFSSAIAMIITTAASYGVLKVGLAVTSGRQITSQEIFDFGNFVPFLLTTILVWIATFIGYMLCILPGIVVAFFLMYAAIHAVDKGGSPVDALKKSVELVQNNIGANVVLLLLTFVAYFVGALLCGIGLLVTMPVALIATAYMYRASMNEPVAA